MKYIKCNPSYFECVEVIQYINDNSSTWKSSKERGKMMIPLEIKAIPMLDKFHVNVYLIYMMSRLMVILVIDL